jgi:hypothetical protein
VGKPSSQAKKDSPEMRKAFLDLVADGHTNEQAARKLGASVRMFFDLRRRDAEFEAEYWLVRRGAVEREVDRCREKLEAADTAVEVKKWQALYQSAQWIAERLIPQFQPVSKLNINSEEKRHVIVEWRTDSSAPVIDGEAVSESGSREALDVDGGAVPIPAFLPAARNRDQKERKALASGS